MNHPQSRSWLPRLTMVLGLSLLAVGVASSCANTNHPAPARSSTPPNNPNPVTPTIEETPDSPVQVTEVVLATPPPEEGGEQEAHAGQLARELEAALDQNQLMREELKALYRRLHIELDTPGRSALIVELFNDPRADMRLLGFDLADRDLSASKDLGDAVGQTVRGLLRDESPQIRAKAARLITRLVPPDGMMVLTSSLQVETDPVAAEPMLLGIARWPNADARQAVRSWLDRDDAPLVALCSAAWSMEREGLWDALVDHPVLLSRLRTADAPTLREDGMKLLAKLGTSDDLRRLIELMLSSDPSVVRWAATALVETPRSVEVLAQSAMDNEVLYQAAGEALIKHRATPEGLRRLAELPQSDAELRRQLLERMGQAIDRERLGEAVRLAQLGPDISIVILSRLISSENEISPRIAKGVLELASLQLDAGRPNRVNEALLALEGVSLDPADQVRRDALRVQSLILLNRFDEAASVSLAWALWKEAIGRASDAAQRARVAQYLLGRADLGLHEAQKQELEAFIPTEQD